MTITVALVTFVIKSPGVYILLDMVGVHFRPSHLPCLKILKISPIISIVFNMIMIRVGFSANGNMVGVAFQQITLAGVSEQTYPSHVGRSSASYGMKSITSTVAQFERTDADASSFRCEDTGRQKSKRPVGEFPENPFKSSS